MSIKLEKPPDQILTPPQSTAASPKLLQKDSRTSSHNDVIENNKTMISSILYKRSTHTKQWKKKWVVLRKCQLSYYKDSREHKPLKVYNSDNLLSFNIIPDQTRNHLAIYTSSKVLHFKSDDDMTKEREFGADDADKEENGEYDEDEEYDAEEEEQDDARNSNGSINSSSGGVTNNQHTLPLHSIQNKQQSQLKRSGSVTDSLNTELSDDFYSSDGLTSDSLLTPNHISSSSQYFTTLDAPKEEDEKEKSPVKHLQRKRQSLSREPSSEYIIEEGSVEILKKRYNYQWKKCDMILTNQCLRLLLYNGRTVYFPVNDIQDVIELDPIHKRDWCIMIITPLKRLRLSCNDEQEMTKWFSALKAAVVASKKK
ncbi:hypothetical protein SBY92_002648 [Candida maltosa Xu316]